VPPIPYTADELRDRIRTLEDGLLQVAKGVQFADRGVTYNSAAEIRERIDYFSGQLTQLTSGASVVPRSKQTLGVSRNGF
jgi:hypothetical protein